MRHRASSKQLLFVVTVGDVDGGLNPRLSGAVRKIGTKLAVERFVAKGLQDRPLSTPSAAEGGGPKASVYRGLSPSHNLPSRSVTDCVRATASTVIACVEWNARRICADSRRRQQGTVTPLEDVCTGEQPGGWPNYAVSPPLLPTLCYDLRSQVEMGSRVARCRAALFCGGPRWRWSET